MAKVVGYKHPLCNVYKGMKSRCYRKDNPKYPKYGARGIKVCDRWLELKGDGFRNFIEDMGERPEGYYKNTRMPKYTLGRIDNDGDYEPENCRWETAKQQCRNRGSNKVLNIDGEERYLTDVMKQYSVSSGAYYSRIKTGWSAVDAATTPSRSGNYRGRLKNA